MQDLLLLRWHLLGWLWLSKRVRVSGLGGKGTATKVHTRAVLALLVSVTGHLLVIICWGPGWVQDCDLGFGAWAFDTCSKDVWLMVSGFGGRANF